MLLYPEQTTFKVSKYGFPGNEVWNDPDSFQHVTPQHLINWTMKDTSKRVEFSIGISYRSDISQVTDIIQKTLESNEAISQVPAPSIFLQTFADSAVEVKISFWVPDLSIAGSVRSHVMAAVYRSLSDEGIELPYLIKKYEYILKNNAGLKE